MREEATLFEEKTYRKHRKAKVKGLTEKGKRQCKGPSSKNPEKTNPMRILRRNLKKNTGGKTLATPKRK